MWHERHRVQAPEDPAAAGGAPPPPVVTAPSPPPPTPSPAPAPEGKWPTAWREDMAGGDGKQLEQLMRYATPAEVAKALIASKAMISSGEYKRDLPTNAKPEELAEWRKSRGIPEEPTGEKGYKLDLGKGFVVADEDQPYIEQFLKAAHLTHSTPAQVNALIRSYYDVEEHITAKRLEDDAAIAETSEEELRAEWGQEFIKNRNLIGQFLESHMPEDARMLFMQGRLADGTPIMSHPDVLKSLLRIALIENPSGVAFPAGDGGTAGLDEEMRAVKKQQATREGRNDPKLDARMRELIEAKMRLDPEWAKQQLGGVDPRAIQ